MFLGIFFILQFRRAARWVPVLVLCHTLILLPTVYPTHLAYRLKADYAARQACCADGNACARHAKAAIQNRCCAQKNAAPGNAKRSSCPVCREFHQFILLQFPIITVPPRIETIAPIGATLTEAPIQQCPSTVSARAPPAIPTVLL